MPEEVLNIEYHIKQMVLKALNMFKYKTDAAAALGISVKTLNGFIKIYGIVKNGHQYFINIKTAA